ncbi:MFS transporter [Thiohalocapsa sp. ML1]|jgi:MFS family permease|uniref:MFS transporter n=1 Tax=Thiohalocapsa sp. ML1 TaxID=1431688 RepID=UPI0007322A1A|nr:MFS transporter [Thiohalocapsa sp. ML1]
MNQTLLPIDGPARVAPPGTLGQLYDLVTGDEDARVCKDIPPESCHEQPRNFFAYLVANLLSKVADDLSSAKLVLPWLLGALGAPAVLVGLLVPIREAGVLLPQLAVAAYIRRMPLRKPVWILGALLSALGLGAIALAALTQSGAAAGWTIIALLVVLSLARGLCSVSAKDVLGKTVSKSRRGRLMGWSAGIAGGATLALGLGLGFVTDADAERLVYAVLLGAGALMFVLGALVFGAIREQPGATAGGGNALTEALASLDLLRTDPDFRRYLLTRIGLLTLALVPPFYVLLLQRASDSALSGLGLLIIASGLASAVSAPLWGRFSDRSARLVLVLAAALGGVTGIATWVVARLEPGPLVLTYALAGLFLLVNVAHAGVRIGRKVYLVDMASNDNRAAMVAVSNTIIGVMMLLGGLIGLLADLYDTATLILVLSIGALLVAAYALGLREVSDEHG